jgi:hypothetical protein
MRYRGENPKNIKGYGNAIAHSLKVNIGGNNIQDTNGGNSKWSTSSRKPFAKHQKHILKLKSHENSGFHP